VLPDFQIIRHALSLHAETEGSITVNAARRKAGYERGCFVGGERAVMRGVLRLNSEDTLNAQVGDLLVSSSKRRHTAFQPQENQKIHILLA